MPALPSPAPHGSWAAERSCRASPGHGDGHRGPGGLGEQPGGAAGFDPGEVLAHLCPGEFALAASTPCCAVGVLVTRLRPCGGTHVGLPAGTSLTQSPREARGVPDVS